MKKEKKSCSLITRPLTRAIIRLMRIRLRPSWLYFNNQVKTLLVIRKYWCCELLAYLEPASQEFVLELKVVALALVHFEGLVEDGVGWIVLDVLPATIAVSGAQWVKDFNNNNNNKWFL